MPSKREKALEAAFLRIRPNIGWRSPQGDNPDLYYCEFCASCAEDFNDIKHHEDCPIHAVDQALATPTDDSEPVAIKAQQYENYVKALEERLHWVLYSGPLNLSENRMRWLHEPFGDDLSKLPDAGKSVQPRCVECHGLGQVQRAYGFVPCPACDGRGN